MMIIKLSISKKNELDLMRKFNVNFDKHRTVGEILTEVKLSWGGEECDRFYHNN
ncbi:MAG TPA: hypothetical protein V6D28_19860 [Leptolyngbyaceae cyanobacterium]